jgi:cytoskeleton protein RodZ
MQPIGSTLRRERERRGISLEDVASSTKIRLPYLQAIEQDHLDELPGGIIGKGFVRAYAHEVGIDEAEAIASYVANRSENNVQLVPPMLPKRAAKRPHNLATRLPSWAFVAGFLAIGVGFVILGVLRNQYLSLLDSSAAHVSTDSSPASSQMQVANETLPTEPAPNKGTGSAPSPDGEQRENSLVATSGGEALTLVINVRQDAWMSIVADGHRILADTLVAPTERVITAHSAIVVRAGNTGGIDLRFNGENLPPQGGYGEARTLRFDASGLLPATPAVDSPSPSTTPSASPVDTPPPPSQQ